MSRSMYWRLAAVATLALGVSPSFNLGASHGAALVAEDFVISGQTINGGGGTSAGGTFVLTGTLAQPDAAPESVGDDFALVSGFWRGDVVASPACPTDVDDSGSVDFSDLLVVLAAWGPCPECPSDLDGSGSVDFADLLAVLAAWGDCP